MWMNIDCTTKVQSSRLSRPVRFQQALDRLFVGRAPGYLRERFVRKPPIAEPSVLAYPEASDEVQWIGRRNPSKLDESVKWLVGMAA